MIGFWFGYQGEILLFCFVGRLTFAGMGDYVRSPFLVPIASDGEG